MKNSLLFTWVVLLLLSCGENPNLKESKLTSTVPSSSSQYNEAPERAAAVAAGALPPVSERLPAVPQVIVPFNEIGKYGDELRFGLSELGNMDLFELGENQKIYRHWQFFLRLKVRVLSMDK
ncbi:hypothetical protein SAMN04488514_11954 [Kriegella aquimaris]|uniref:Uncharacterized protein n=1 Tax=Kriegella aquimaris TaxID=192904 RepID=A0A1G9XXP4_9FLAO|nr:hypothetical protein SAMN04488514_11954 [Kriegella aquimaris]